ncbi:MAG TPA: CheR family methyltransferase [Roseiflexaceae bacterium]|nr:CheR family methyltransferase [Roseiflexaceae bacterium]
MDLPLTDDLYLRFRDLLNARCGLFYPESKRGDLAYGLNAVLRASGLPDLDALEQAARAPGPIWDALLAQLTIGETYFFRNAPQINALRQTILPELIARRSSMRSLRIWSAGCATGEEPYSVAMLIDELLPEREAWHITIIATDINQQFLARAREGLYGEWSFRETTDAQRARFFTPEGNRWRVQPHIRRAVQFAPLNLVEPSYPSIVNGTCALDLILCRNVTIYFDEATTRQVAERFYHALAPGGWLVVGHAEPQASVYHQFLVQNLPDTIVYRKSLDAPLFGFDPARGSFSLGEQPVLHPRLEPRRPADSQRQDSATHDRPRPAAPAEQRPAAPEPRPATEPPADPVAALVWSSIRARMALGDKAGAERLARDLLLREPQHAEALGLLGRLCADAGDWEGARQHCERALAVSPLAVEVHYTLAQVYEHQNLLDEALAAYRRTVFLNRNFVLGTLGMANVWQRMGRRSEAHRSYQKVLRQLSGSPPSELVQGSEDVTVGEITALVLRQLKQA